MAAKAPPVTSVSRLSRIGLALGISKSEPQDDSWYIPYNGPYESPKSRPHTSVGSEWDSIFGRSDEQQLLKSPTLGEKGVNRGAIKRAPSMAPGFTATHDRRRKHSSYAPLPISHSFHNQAGGIGDTPIPRQRSSTNNLTGRLSLTSFFSFGPSSKKRPTTPTQVVQIQNGTFRRDSTSSRNTRRSISSRRNKPKPHISKQNDLHPSNNLIVNTSPTMTHQPQPSSFQPNPPSLSESHNYAATFPASQPLVSSHRSIGEDHVAFPGQKSIPSLKSPPRAPVLKASVSTPDLRTFRPPKGKSYWLSAETWCDAVVFPRPRFAIRHASHDKRVVNRRMVSPPGTPLLGSDYLNKSLKKSKSVIDLQTSNFATVTPTRVVRDGNEAASSSNQMRPRSFALDDLAIPSPIPSLAT
jgi:serine/arginine repetitive matrix protein 2